MLSTLGVRSAIGEATRKKLSFRNVSNVVVQLLHTIKPYSVPTPFSHLANGGTGFRNDSTNGFQENKTRQVIFIPLIATQEINSKTLFEYLFLKLYRIYFRTKFLFIKVKKKNNESKMNSIILLEEKVKVFKKLNKELI